MFLKKRAFLKDCNLKFKHGIKNSKPYLKLVGKCLQKFQVWAIWVTSIQRYEDSKLGENAKNFCSWGGQNFGEAYFLNKKWPEAKI